MFQKTTEEKAKAAKEALRQAANELDVTYASLGYGSAGASSNKDGVPVVDNNLAKVFRAGRSFPGEMYIARDAIAGSLFVHFHVVCRFGSDFIMLRYLNLSFTHCTYRQNCLFDVDFTEGWLHYCGRKSRHGFTYQVYSR